MALFVLQAGADPRLGTKACIVESALTFNPRSGTTAIWGESQKSFVLNVYSCDEALRKGIDLGSSEICQSGEADRLAIKTTIHQWETGWQDALSKGPDVKNTDRTIPWPAEFQQSFYWLPHVNHPIFRLYPDLKFEFVRIAVTSGGDTAHIWTLAGTCADFE